MFIRQLKLIVCHYSHEYEICHILLFLAFPCKETESFIHPVYIRVKEERGGYGGRGDANFLPPPPHTHTHTLILPRIPKKS